MLERAGETVKLGFKVHPHMLRHSCGFVLANKGHPHENNPGEYRPPVDHAHGPIHGTVANAV